MNRFIFQFPLVGLLLLLLQFLAGLLQLLGVLYFVGLDQGFGLFANLCLDLFNQLGLLLVHLESFQPFEHGAHLLLVGAQGDVDVLYVDVLHLRNLEGKIFF